MSDADLWRAVGAELRAIRERAGWRSTNAIARSGAAVDQKTLDAIERGQAGNVAKIGAYCRALGVDLADVLAVIIARPVAVSADAMRVARLYDAAPDAGRRALDALAAALAAPSAPATPPGAPTPARARARTGTGNGRTKRGTP